MNRKYTLNPLKFIFHCDKKNIVKQEEDNMFLNNVIKYQRQSSILIPK